MLLRLMAVVTRQWIDASAELVVRLGADSAVIGAELLGAPEAGRVARVEGGLGDLHNGGRSVHVVVFEDGTRIVYKPKDLRVDVAWCALVERLNAVAPVRLRAVRALARDGYGWTEFVEHAPCADDRDVQTYFTRAGAWLALFYCFAAGDMHQENIIAAGAHPVPIDIETILQATIDRPDAGDPESDAHRAAVETIANSVMMVRLIPSYLRYPDNEVGAIGGLLSDWAPAEGIRWTDVNTDAMRPARPRETDSTTPNLPHLAGRYAKFADHVEAFVEGFRPMRVPGRVACRRCDGRALRRLRRPAGPKTTASHQVLRHAAAAAEGPTAHGRRRHLVCTGRLRCPAVRLGQGHRSAVAARAGGTLSAAGVEHSVFCDAQRHHRHP
ncbi:hypothetical protein BZL30_0629 [Mycobacterium kansasii]|uniref:Lantibiotic biosynthesis protein dehydration domain-containing protein n=1 Tax=Mycobacterium kansasii TaxID=1768 RepID=A0A1V3XUW8_MYCKA|nr:hypothetical protein BZL30_0629 [Mycobacterium kansasii]